MGNYHVSAHKARESRKAAQQLLTPRQVQEASDYEHEEILQQSGVPGMGLRVAVSSADLHPHPHLHPHPDPHLNPHLNNPNPNPNPNRNRNPNPHPNPNQVSSSDLQALHKEAEKGSYHFGKDE